MTEQHVLVRQAMLMTADAASHDRVAALAARLQAQLDEAVTCEDAVRAAVVLSEARRALSVAAQQLVGGGLVPGDLWFLAQQAALYGRAVALLGPTQSVIPRPAVEPLTVPAGQPGPRSMFRI